MTARMTLKTALKLNADLNAKLDAEARKTAFLRKCLIDSLVRSKAGKSMNSIADVERVVLPHVDDTIRIWEQNDKFVSAPPALDGSEVIQMLDPVDGWKTIQPIYNQAELGFATADVDYRKTSPRHIKSRIVKLLPEGGTVEIYA